MRKFLYHDPGTRELRLVYTGQYAGQHERTEYRVTSGRGGNVIRNEPGRDGAPVFGTAPGLYIKGPAGNLIPVWTEEIAVGPTVKTACQKAADARRKCGLCASERQS